jgi:Na+/melibiose symporter-like transporter
VIFFLLGLLAGLVLDRAWWESKANKYDKNVEELEHYHWGLLAWIIAYLTPLWLSDVLWGLGAALVMAEWAQIGEWENGAWRRGHPFAYGSNHFKVSTAIGAALVAILIIPLLLPIVLR